MKENLAFPLHILISPPSAIVSHRSVIASYIPYAIGRYIPYIITGHIPYVIIGSNR